MGIYGVCFVGLGGLGEWGEWGGGWMMGKVPAHPAQTPPYTMHTHTTTLYTLTPYTPCTHCTHCTHSTPCTRSTHCTPPPPVHPPCHSQPLEAVRAAAVEVITPLFKSLVDAAEVQLLKMHTEDVNKQLPTPPLPPGLGGGHSGGGVMRSASGYMVGLTKLMGQWRCVGVFWGVLVFFGVYVFVWGSGGVLVFFGGVCVCVFVHHPNLHAPPPLLDHTGVITSPDVHPSPPPPVGQ